MPGIVLVSSAHGLPLIIEIISAGNPSHVRETRVLFRKFRGADMPRTTSGILIRNRKIHLFGQ